jgi:hypothetical protein
VTVNEFSGQRELQDERRAECVRKERLAARPIRNASLCSGARLHFGRYYSVMIVKPGFFHHQTSAASHSHVE